MVDRTSSANETAGIEQRPLVSVVLCTFNGRPHIIEQVDSLLTQSRPPDEIILADDGSSDGTPDLAATQIASVVNPPRLRVLDVRPVPGVTQNFSRAMQAASGEIVFLADQDDVWRVDKIEIQLRDLAREPGALLSVSNARLVNADGADTGIDLFGANRVRPRDVRAVTSGRAPAWLVRRSVFPGMTFAFRRELLDSALPIPPMWPHDYWLSLVAASVGRIVVSPECLVNYRQHESNVVGLVPHTFAYRSKRVLRSEKTADLYRSRFSSLLSHLEAIQGADPGAIAAVEGKLRFETRRSSLPSNRLRRSIPIIAMTSGGAYSRYASNGSANGIRDALSAGGT